MNITELENTFDYASHAFRSMLLPSAAGDNCQMTFEISEQDGEGH